MSGSNEARPDWDAYFLDIARAVSARADCTRAKHGAVIVKDNRIVATGYNGPPAGEPGCLTDGACPRGQKTQEEVPSLSGDYSDCTALHAEVNAVAYASRDRTEGATIYITGEPCSWCRKVIKAAGITRVIYPSEPNDSGGVMMAWEWVYLITGCVLALPTAFFTARGLHEDVDTDDFEAVGLTAAALVMTPLIWGLMLAAAILVAFFWSFYQLAKPGRFEIPDWIKSREKRLRE